MIVIIQAFLCAINIYLYAQTRNPISLAAAVFIGLLTLYAVYKS